MEMSKSNEAKETLQSAITKIKIAAVKLGDPKYSDERKFSIAWHLGFMELQDLENFRISN